MHWVLRKISASRDLTVENFWKSYFRKCRYYSKGKHTEILEIVILRNLSKINDIYLRPDPLYDFNLRKYRTKPHQT